MQGRSNGLWDWMHARERRLLQWQELLRDRHSMYGRRSLQIDCDHKYSCLYVVIDIGNNNNDKYTINNNKSAITNRNGPSIIHHQ
jgi:hypothetical protein